MSTDDSKHYYCDEGTDEDPTPVHRCNQNEPTNHPAPVILSEEAVAEIEAQQVRAESLIDDDTEVTIAALISNVPALCQTVRAAWARIADLTAQWCQCGHAKDRHGFFSDHDECYECDQASPDLCCEWRPAPRTPDDTYTALRDQLAHAKDKDASRCDDIGILHQRLAQVEKERDHYKRLYEL